MADTPRIEKYSNAADFVDLPGFTIREPSVGQNAAFVQFEGDTRPRSYIGEGGDTVWQVSGTFNAHITAQATLLGDLKDILDEVHASADRRLRLTTGGSVMDTLYPTKIVCALEGSYRITQTPRGSNIFQVSMALREVVG